MAVLGYEASTWTEGLLITNAVAFFASAYLYWFVRLLPKGFPRVIASTPVFTAFVYLPFIFNRHTHLIGIPILFCILTWLSNFKILLLCWTTGPGYDPWLANCFPRFAIAMTYPAHMKRVGKVVKRVPVEYPSWIDRVTKSEVWYMLLVRSALKLIALGMLLELLLQRESLNLPLIVIHLLFSIQLYLFVTIVLEILAAIANTVFAITIEPHFDNPFAAVSLEEFWARRWNLLVSNCLRETVFNPVLDLLQQAQNPKTGEGMRGGVTGTGAHGNPKTGEGMSGGVAGTGARGGIDGPKLVAMLAAFLVSGLAHELAVYYVTLEEPSWQMSSFFVVQGFAVAFEASWKLSFSWRPPRWVAKFLTLGFAFLTSHWLFWPPLDNASGQVLLEVQRMLPW